MQQATLLNPNTPPPSSTSSAAAPVPDSTTHQRYLTLGLLQIDTHRREVRFDEQLVHVTPTEYMILVCLIETPGRVVIYSDIVQRIRGYTVDEADAHGLLRAHVRNLRRKLDRRYLVSVYAVGYMLVDPDEDAQGNEHSPNQADDDDTDEDEAE